MDELSIPISGAHMTSHDKDKDPKLKLSRKARIAAKKAEKRTRRQNDSDNEDVPLAGLLSLPNLLARWSVF